eukprot:CAMPEP_0167748638 /NCGR_PEP_ID=MMETSP0110_2-20121227/4948_1 /TAXON_ID=629695 /ORGANISM="Gymnochlora sp., Strain CCMP2014" /LENGTH=611 /DNA_ID=CAMNT_0007633673 /DNA_START=78 /DNA_END=1914 /DNA_ORIENTATION=-
MSTVEFFVVDMLRKQKNIREIISKGRKMKFSSSSILAAIQRERVKVMGKNEMMEEEQLSSDSDEEIKEPATPMEQDFGVSESKMMQLSPEDKKNPAEDEEEGWDDEDEGDWGDDWDDENKDDPGAHIDPPILTRTLSFKVHQHEDVQTRMDSLLERVGDLLYISPDEAGCLLRHYRWDDNKLKKDWFSDQKKVRCAVGVSRRKELPSSSDGMVQCLSWGCKRVPYRKAHALACGHYFCKRCWRSFLESEIDKGRTCIFAKCPAMRCRKNHVHKFGCACTELVPSSTFEKYVKQNNILDKYKSWNLQSFVEGQEGLKWCPNPKCSRVIEYKLGGAKTIECQCGHRFCFSCNRNEHEPAPCDLVSKWLKSTAVSEDATALWLKARTKTCPKCGVRIEKNRACNHMHCTKCGHHFCWLCKGPWSKHGTATGGFYVCKKYNEDIKRGHRSNEEKDMITTQKMLQKYKYYVARFNDAKNGVALTNEREEKLNRVFHKKNLSVELTKFITDATKSLVKARTCMQWCYVLDFYLLTGKEKKLFEFQQQMLIEQTESLQDLIESNDEHVERLLQKKKDILSKTNTLNNLRKRMIRLVNEGNFESVLSYKGDSKSDNGNA